MKGDVPLITLDEKRNICYHEIIDTKKKLLEGINNGTDERCKGCPYLKLDHWPDIEDEKVGCISIEHHSVCNMRCTYCSETYYGGVKPYYDVESLIMDINETSSDLHIAWGGGEPVLGKEFDHLFLKINNKFKPRTQRVFSNALKYSASLQEALDNRSTSITTSIDAGSEETFWKVRGAKKMEKVLSNLRLYSEVNPDLVTVKYIFTDDNFEISELEKFVDKITQYDLAKCNFLISSNFKDENVNDEKIISMMTLYWLLYRKGILAVTFDDHVYKRVNDVGSKYLNKFDQAGLPNKYLNIIQDIKESINYHNKKDIIVWGVGEFSKQLFKDSRHLNLKNICMIVDGNPNRWGKNYMGHVVRHPKSIKESDASIVIASANYYGEILNQIILMGIHRKRLVPTFII